MPTPRSLTPNTHVVPRHILRSDTTISKTLDQARALAVDAGTLRSEADGSTNLDGRGKRWDLAHGDRETAHDVADVEERGAHDTVPGADHLDSSVDVEAGGSGRGTQLTLEEEVARRSALAPLDADLDSERDPDRGLGELGELLGDEKGRAHALRVLEPDLVLDQVDRLDAERRRQRQCTGRVLHLLHENDVVRDRLQGTREDVLARQVTKVW